MIRTSIATIIADADLPLWSLQQWADAYVEEIADAINQEGSMYTYMNLGFFTLGVFQC